MSCSLKTATEVEINRDVDDLLQYLTIHTKSTPLLRPRGLGPCSELEDQDEVTLEVSAYHMARNGCLSLAVLQSVGPPSVVQYQLLGSGSWPALHTLGVAALWHITVCKSLMYVVQITTG